MAPCAEPFWTAVLRNRSFRFTLPLAWLGFALHLGVAGSVVAMWVFESTGKEWRCRWMRCRCPSAVLRRFCPLPKGTREEEVAMMDHDDERVWDGVRVSLYWVAAVYALLPAVYGLLIGSMFVAALRRFDEDLPEGMSVDAELGGGFLRLAWGSAGFAVLSAVCVTGRWWLGRKPMGWMDGLDVGGLDVAATDGETTPGEYKDGGEREDGAGVMSSLN